MPRVRHRHPALQRFRPAGLPLLGPLPQPDLPEALHQGAVQDLPETDEDPIRPASPIVFLTLPPKGLPHTPEQPGSRRWRGPSRTHLPRMRTPPTARISHLPPHLLIALPTASRPLEPARRAGTVSRPLHGLRVLRNRDPLRTLRLATSPMVLSPMPSTGIPESRPDRLLRAADLRTLPDPLRTRAIRQGPPLVLPPMPAPGQVSPHATETEQAADGIADQDQDHALPPLRAPVPKPRLPQLPMVFNPMLERHARRAIPVAHLRNLYNVAERPKAERHPPLVLRSMPSEGRAVANGTQDSRSRHRRPCAVSLDVSQRCLRASSSVRGKCSPHLPR